MSRQRRRPWWDKLGWQGLSLFIVMIILGIISKNKLGQTPESYYFLTGMFLMMFLMGEK